MKKKRQETKGCRFGEEEIETDDQPGEEAIESSKGFKGGKKMLDGGQVKEIKKTTQERGEVDGLPIEFVFEKVVIKESVNSQGAKGKHEKGPEVAKH